VEDAEKTKQAKQEAAAKRAALATAAGAEAQGKLQALKTELDSRSSNGELGAVRCVLHSALRCSSLARTGLTKSNRRLLYTHAARACYAVTLRFKVRGTVRL
jgi:hypothetical protein